MRNIVEIPAVILGAIVFLFLAGGKARQKALYLSLVFVPVTLGFLGVAYKSDSRWRELKDSVVLVMQEDDPARLLALGPGDEGLPLLPNHKPVNESNFTRLARYRVGLHIIRSNPLGIGFGRNAFGHYLKDRFNSGVGLNAESSLLDMTVGAGLPGVALFGALIFTILAMTFRSFRKNADFYALLLYLVIVCFAARMVFDSVLRDHLLEIFLFVTGMLATRISVLGAGPVLSLREGKITYGEVAGGEQEIKAV